MLNAQELLNSFLVLVSFFVGFECRLSLLGAGVGICYHAITDRRKFRSQTSDSMDRWKSTGGKTQRREEERRSKKRKSDRKAAKHCVFPVICGSGGLKSRLAKAAGAEPAGQMRDESCTPLWREAHFEVKM